MYKRQVQPELVGTYQIVMKLVGRCGAEAQLGIEQIFPLHLFTAVSYTHLPDFPKWMRKSVRLVELVPRLVRNLSLKSVLKARNHVVFTYSV